jgi:hypothetical protein
MAKRPSVSNHHDISKAAPGKDTNPRHAHPHEAVPVRVAKESGFAAPGLDVPAETQRPTRPAGTDQLHPLNKPLRDENRSLTGPQLGRGGTDGPRLTPVAATETYGDRPFPSKSYSREADIAHANTNFQDVSSLIMRPRGGASASDGDGDE